MVIMQHKIIYAGVDSSDYGVYISGEGAFNAPKRVVNMVAVPGRNGTIAIDQGYYENITVSYPAYISAPDLQTLAENLSDFRNAIVSNVGYNRLEDSINDNEYRMAVYSDGLEFEPIGDSTTVELELNFNCKPQRWLKDGERPITVSSGATVPNPTPYSANPLLAVSGNGTISFNGYDVKLANAQYGIITLVDGQKLYKNDSGTIEESFTVSSDFFNGTDLITIPSITAEWHATLLRSSASISSVTSSNVGDGTVNQGKSSFLHQAYYTLTVPEASFAANADHTSTNVTTCTVNKSYGNAEQFRVTTTIEYTASTNTFSFSVVSEDISLDKCVLSLSTLSFDDITVDSSVDVLGNPTYIDCDLDEAYKVLNGNYISLNRYVAVGSDLPKLAPGPNLMTYSNTITGVTVIPRWWKL